MFDRNSTAKLKLRKDLKNNEKGNNGNSMEIHSDRKLGVVPEMELQNREKI